MKRLLFQDKQNGENQGGKNKTAQTEIKKFISGNDHVIPHFIAIIRVAIAEIRAARAAIRPETATIHGAAFRPFSLFFGNRGSFLLAIVKYTLYRENVKPNYLTGALTP
ncbi:MAG: hypothetical protein LBK64_06450 [Spirochaetaceae bacterium]|nr:hypothetical protein [Spirochaetaceae bacterium]